ncbi:MAG: hypothetical protein L6R39_004505 [Caloplaca ligustica]|nr:MAG: hypothetical protein L6R39_004505 [Caloplaca ligustica]
MDWFHRTNPELCSWLDAPYDVQDPSVQLWWRSAGTVLANLLHGAGYSEEDQIRHLLFYGHSVAPSLGVFPCLDRNTFGWKSFMTDDHTPIELSWNWSSGGRAPEVRYSIEPIGIDAGTFIDPYNVYAAPRLLRCLRQTSPHVNLEWFDHFSKELLGINRSRYQASPRFEGPPESVKSSSSSTFLAFDLRRSHEVAVKAYLLPGAQANQKGTTSLSLIKEAVQKLPPEQVEGLSAFNLLLEYTRVSAIGSRLECDILGIDCVQPTEARLKVYMRSRSTSFLTVRSIMTLDGRISGPQHESGLDELFELWKLFFGQDLPLGFDTDLPVNGHRTAGILYYFDISRKASMPLPKIYLPVRHYGSNDHDIARRLARFMSSRGQCSSADRYLATLEHTL